jgi:hypothetical protein
MILSPVRVVWDCRVRRIAWDGNRNAIKGREAADPGKCVFAPEFARAGVVRFDLSGRSGRIPGVAVRERTFRRGLTG